MPGYQARVAAKIAERKDLMLAIRNESAQRVVEVMQTPRSAGGNMRVKTGFLRATLVAVKGDPHFTIRTKPEGDGRYSYDAAQVVMVIASADLSDTVSVAYTASYARPREYGARGQEGDRFVGLAAQRWPQIVAEVAREAEARIKR